MPRRGGLSESKSLYQWMILRKREFSREDSAADDWEDCSVSIMLGDVTGQLTVGRVLSVMVVEGSSDAGPMILRAPRHDHPRRHDEHHLSTRTHRQYGISSPRPLLEGPRELTSQQPPKQANPTSRASTLLFKKHKITVLLVLQPHEPLTTAKEKLLQALKARNVTEINGDLVPDDPDAIEFGMAEDRNDLDKGWTRLDADTKAKTDAAGSLQAAGLQDGHPVAFRFRKAQEAALETGDVEVELEDPGWDVVTPHFDDEEEQ